MALTAEQQGAFLREALDPTKVDLYCGLHHYHGPVKEQPEIKPAPGCQRCWFVFYFHDIVSSAPHERARRLDELDEIIHKMVEEINVGTFDFKPFRHAQIEFGEE